MNVSLRFRLATLFVVFGVTASACAETSELWGANGEWWSPLGRLPDFSHAGYHEGEAALPNVPPGVSVKQFGAKGDGASDDTRAFLAAIAATTNGAIEVPPGRYRITNILEITHSRVVLRGAGPDKSILFFPKPLHEVRPVQSATTEGRATSEYSWSGGFVWFKGNTGRRVLAEVIGEARRGDTTLRVSTTDGLRVGRRVEITLSDVATNSLAAELYSNDAGDTRNLRGNSRASLVCRIVKITGDRVQFDRPLRCDVRKEWSPRVMSFEPSVSESGVENLCFEFPDAPYAGHFTELGFNAVAFSGVADCWARNLRVMNPDSGIMFNGRFCTVQQVVFESVRKPDSTGCVGHHGVYFYEDDNLFDGFDYRMRFIHDITVSESAGNVIAGGKGIDLCFDHHKRAPYENLFVNIDAGAGTRLWKCGGGAGLGRNCGARGTFWNIRAAAPQNYPPVAFGPPSMNIVGLETRQPSEKSATNRWLEAISPARLMPQDIHAAQVEKRLSRGGRGIAN